MKVIQRESTYHVLRFDKGDEAISLLRTYCEEQCIMAGHFTALGACTSVTLAFYNLEKKIYKDKTITKDLEIAGIIGNVSKLQEEIVIHAHGSFSDDTFKTFSGHVKRLVVAATCEVHLSILSGKLERGFNKEIGLNLLKEKNP